MVSKEEALMDYARSVAELCAEGERRGVSKSQMSSLLAASLDAASSTGPDRMRPLKRLLQVLWLVFKVIVVLVLLYAAVACHLPTQKMLSRHIQGFIYPFMRGLRKATLPVLRAYPQLTEWHEEPCLVRNPFYGMRGPDCWPCEDVRSVLVFSSAPSNFVDTYYHNGIPFIILSAGKQVSMADLQLMYQENAEKLQRFAPRVLAENFISTSLSLSDLLNLPERNISELHPFAHLTWKITRSDSARVLRQLFSRPQFVPTTTEIAIQRYLFIDAPLSPKYSLPLTDFANVWVMQGSGSRLIVLSPSPHCSSRCFPVSVLLQQGDLLFYNWQFWRPQSIPVKGATTLSTSYVGSFY